MNEFNYIVLAVPFFVLLIGLEIYAAYKRNMKGYYRLQDSLTSLSIGIGEQVISVFSKVGILYLYSYIYEHTAIFHFEFNVLNVIILLFLFDFIFYWAHRWGHEINFLWAGHVVHHSSEDYNLTTALRQPWFFQLVTFNLFLPLAVLGFDPKILAVVAGIDILYQFWIHTQLIGKLGPLEWVLNTPSHHRVHHGANPQYIDKNYAGVFIIWDRLFGTFEEEKEPVVYGITTPLNSWNPAWANVHYIVDLAKQAKKCNNITDKLHVWVAPPGWQPDYLGGRQYPKPVTVETFQKFDTPVTKTLSVYTLVQFGVLMALATGYLAIANKLDLWISILYAANIFITLASIGGLFEKKKWSFIAEFIRLFSLPWLAYLLPIEDKLWLAIAVGIGAVLSGVSVIWLLAINKKEQHEPEKKSVQKREEEHMAA
jgi:sterol desaturase/sphingolipid hydroxylase (fatty acid hydroxylase superfamily)